MTRWHATTRGLAMTRDFLSFRRNAVALRRLKRRLQRDQRGVSAVEFAFILPIMVSLFIGMIDTSVGIMTARKANMLNRTLVDLTAQMQRVDNTARDAIFAASGTVMEPFEESNPGMSIASIVIDAAGSARVCWVESRNMASPFAAGGTVTLPTNMRIPRTSLVVAVSNVTYQPSFGHVITGSFQLGRTPVYMRPRQGIVGGPSNIEQVERVGRAMC
jgi:Flp pilus assembly protein TadG